jgi:hypothetical protein
MVLTINTDYTESEVDKIFTKAINDAFDTIDEKIWDSPANMFIPYEDGEEDESYSVEFMESHHEHSVLDQLEMYEINMILLLIIW